MSGAGLVQFLALLAVLALTAPPLGRYMAAVYGDPRRRQRARRPGLRPVERVIYRVLGVDPRREQRWNVYAISLLAFSLVSFLASTRCSGSRPRCRSTRPTWPASPRSACNTAVSFVTNTNWQSYGGELTMSHLTQMVGLTVQNFVSAAVGMAVVVRSSAASPAAASARSATSGSTSPARRCGSCCHSRSSSPSPCPSAGSSRTSTGTPRATPVDAPRHPADPRRPGGQPDRHQAARHQRRRLLQRQLRPPVREPRRRSPTSSRCGRSLLIPFALVVTYGVLVGSKRQAHVLLAVMVGILLAFSVFAILAETVGQPEPDGARRRPGRVDAARRRQPRGQGGPLRPGVVRSVGGRDDRHVERLGQLHARQHDAARRDDADAADDVRRGHPGRRRRRA